MSDTEQPPQKLPHAASSGAKIIQVVLQDKSMMGLGDDGQLYRFNYEVSKWVLA